MTTNQEFNPSNPQDVIPESFRGITVQSEEDLIFLGRENLDAIKQAWRREEKNYAETIKTLQAELDIFKGRKIEDIKELAKRHERPEFPRTVVVDGEAEPVDAASLNRKRGATTLNFCGWCNYCTGGEVRLGFDCHITGHCELLWANTEERLKFSTPCLLTNGNQDLLDDMVARLEEFLHEAVAEKRKIEAKIRYVMDSAKKAKHKPLIPQKRPVNWVEAGEKVKYFLGSQDHNILPEKADKFIDGTVVGDSFVCMDELIHTGSCLNGYGLRCGHYNPDMLKDWEFDYLKRHKFYLEMWLKWSKANGATYLDCKKFKKAFLI